MNVTSYHPPTYRKFDYLTPDLTGIGGSETAVVELAGRLALRGHDVLVYSPSDHHEPATDPRGARWLDCSHLDTTRPGFWIINRCPEVLDRFPIDHPGQTLYFLAEDTFYLGMTEERASKLDAYICLCQSHKQYVEGIYPYLKGRIVIGSNGVRMDAIREIEKDPPKRNPRKLIFASSPDRGLLPLLKIFRRAREWVSGEFDGKGPLELHVFYGFQNLLTGTENQPDGHPSKIFYRKCMKEMNQPGVVWHDRTSQKELLREWLSAGIWCHPSVMTETNCLHGDSLVETLRGPIPIRDLVGQTVNLYSCGASGEMSISSAANIRKTRTSAPVIRLTFVSGRGRNAKKRQSLVLTPDHLVMLSDGGYAEAGTLKPGDSIKAFNRRLNGWGDGYDIIGLTGGEMTPEHQFVAQVSAGRKLEAGEVVDHVDGDKSNNEPWNLEIKGQSQHAAEHWSRLSEDQKAAKTAAMISGNKGVPSDVRGARARDAWETFRSLPAEQQEQRYRHAKDPAINVIRSQAISRRSQERWGDKPWWNGDALRLEYVVNQKNTVQIAEEWGTTDGTISTWLKRHGIPARSRSLAASNHMIVDVEDAGTADVYCMDAGPDHNFIANGLVVHNCITAQDAMACGAIPITVPIWAVGEFTAHGVLIHGDPNGDPLTIARFVGEVVRVATSEEWQEQCRREMIPYARDRFNWERMIDLFEAWMHGYAHHRMFHCQAGFSLKHTIGFEKILNVGCCDDAAELRDKRGAVNMDLHAVDLSLNRPNAVDVIGDARDLPAPFEEHSFDCVVATEVLEHFETADVPAQLRKFVRLLKPGGRIVVTVPDDHRDLQGLAENGHTHYAEGISFKHHPVSRETIDRWIKAAGLRLVAYQAMEYGFGSDVRGHGFVAEPEEEC